MPVAKIHVLAGHPRASLQQLIREVSGAMSTLLGAPKDRLQVWVTEVDPGLYAIAGEPADLALQQTPRAEVEIPLIQMVLMEGRPSSLLTQLMAELSAITARVLGGDPARVRVQIDLVTADRWAIGGVPASVLRAEELAARQRAAS